MNNLDFMQALGKIGDDLIENAEQASRAGIQKHRAGRGLYAVGTIAAAAVIAVGIGVYQKTAKTPIQRIPDTPVITEATEPLAVTTRQTNVSADHTQTAAARIGTAHPADETTLETANETAITQAFSETVPTETTAATETEIAVPQTASAVRQTAAATESAVSVQTAAETIVHKGGISAEGCRYQPFQPTVDPDSDSFGADECHHVNIRTADGYYRQLTQDEYSKHGISDTVSESDFGAYLGKITETADSAHHGNAAESQEPKLAGADVYFAAHSGKNKALLIVKQGQQCSVFLADTVNVSEGFRKGMRFFDVQSADDIRSVTYTKRTPADGRMVTALEKTITDSETIGAFYALFCSLTPEDYSILPPHIGTPQWLADAWAAYRAAENPSPRVDYSITFTLKDGTVLSEITYQPFLGNGYVAEMEELTPEQADTLNTLLQK